MMHVWKKLIDLLGLKLKGYLIIDNFFPDEICDHLRSVALNNKQVDFHWNGYVARDFDKGTATNVGRIMVDNSELGPIGIHEGDSLKEIADRYVFSKVSFIRKESYIRSWSFLYDNKADGVGPHIDPGSYYTINTWVTPDQCVEDKSKNGLRIYRKKYDKINFGGIVNRESMKGVKYDVIPYRYNRCVIFRGNTIHETDYVSMKTGHKNKRISYTFLYDKGS